MKEDFLHYLWRLARFDLRDLTTTTDEPLTIQQFGVSNTNAGPDFDDARIRIGGLQWAGKVEMHLRSSEWYDHGHDRDPAYDGVILHVVLEEDRPVYRRDGSRIPCLELRQRIPAGVHNRYWRLLHNEYWVPCQTQLASVTAPVRALWLQRILAERLTRRSAAFAARLETEGRDWEAAFYLTLARVMGGKVNGEAMEMLAASLPLRLLQKHKHSLLQLEALLFGQSGLLPEPAAGEVAYVGQLRREYQLLRTKYELQPLPATAWRFLRMRPNNFPTVRIAQLACLYHRSGQLFGKALAAADVRELRNMFVVHLSNYWRDHYRFGPVGERRPARLGEAAVRSILINAVAPAYFTYGQMRGEQRFQDRAVELLEELPAESNAVIRQWNKLGWPAASAADSQALLELKSAYCAPTRCTSCAVGCAILNRPDAEGAPLLSLNEAARAYRLVG
ncbi:hypothetical protein GGR26_003448 [Lewinella marina]|uniref:DUF2851 domain-containing protein n=1 Tax=Neolewinella marina TaxID=438751 RepID=A0A2G0CCF3_9BACT|nr:DUF2851 family protein [Neolewinella marina]NJB87664.1 hypothetical protein [Neolewinella marina]PHK97653.1 hypothetical protein CGL56_14570 [Neolewinella marina]